MVIGSPIWLVALLPWGMVALWLLRGRRPRVGVPYLPLWHGPVPIPHPRHQLRAMPFAVAMALLAVLLAIVGAGKPAIRGVGPRDGSIPVLVIDRGLSMSARTGGRTRFEMATRALLDAIDPRDAWRSIDLIPVPGGGPIRATPSELLARVALLAPTARDTRELVAEVVYAQRAAAKGPVWVVTDQVLPARDGVIAIPPESGVDDVGIVSLAARERPTPQVMVRVRNRSRLMTSTLLVSTDGDALRQPIDLPPAGGTRDYFVNPARLGTVVSARLIVQDDVPANDQAWLVREGSSPRVEVRTEVSPELQRVITAYQRVRPVTEASLRLPVVGDKGDVPADGPAVIIDRAGQETSTGDVQVVPHSVTAHVSLDHVVVRVGGEPPAGWAPLVRIGSRTAVAVRPDGPRQVWVGFDSPGWSTTPDYVVFWTNVFDWAGGAGETFVSHSLGEWTPEWKPSQTTESKPGDWPGLYRRSDGALRAFNVPDVQFFPPVRTDWRPRVTALVGGSSRLELSGPLMVLAAGAMLVAAATWRRAARPSSLPELSAPVPTAGSA